MSTATPAQIGIIHTLISKLGVADDVYRDMLASYDVKSSKKLSFNQAKDFINLLVQKAKACNLPTPQPSQTKPGFATNAQRSMLFKMWEQISTANDKHCAFKAFILNRWNISVLTWMPSETVPKIKKALEAMGAKHVKRI
jgi:hypothetical protein